MQRRDFIAAAATTGAALALPEIAHAGTRTRQQRSIWIDAQGGISGVDEKPDGQLVPTSNLIEAVRQRRLDIVSITVAEPGNGPDRFRSAIEGIATMRRCARSPTRAACLACT